METKIMNMHNNPASRFLSIVNQGKKFDGGKTCLSVWSDILSIPEIETPSLLERISKALALPEKVETKILMLDGQNPELLLKWLPKVNSVARNTNFLRQWAQFIAAFTDDVVYGIEICADTLSRLTPEKIVTKEQILELDEKIDQLIKDVENDDIDQWSKYFILSSLYKLQKSIDEVPILGIEGIEETYGTIIGAAIINRDKKIRSEDSKSACGFWEILGRIAIVLSIASGCIAITDKIVDLLPDSNSTKIEVVEEISKPIEV